MLSLPWLRFLGIVAILLVMLPVCSKILYLVPDSAGHLAYARSLLWDQDLDFSNEYDRYGMIDRDKNIMFGEDTAAGKPGNPFGLGAGVLWLPFILLAAAAAVAGQALGLEVATDGFGTATLWAAHLGTWSYALASLALWSACLRDLLGGRDRRGGRAALIGALLGTPTIYYILQMPSYSHVCSLFTVSALVTCSLRWRTSWTAGRAVMLGALVGLAGLVRLQDLGFIVFPFIVGYGGGALRSKAGLRWVPLFAGGAVLAFLPQPMAWASIYGSFWHIPQGEGFLLFSLGRLWQVMFATRHGLITWSPVVALAIAGWLLAVREPKIRGLGVACIVAFSVQWVANALPVDWWAGWSFGARRFIGCVPLVVLGLAFAVSRLGAGGRITVYLLGGANLVQWLRVATGSLSGEGDPGWNTLWGSGFISFLGKCPGALWDYVRVPWTSMQVLRHPVASHPRFHVDPTLFLVLLYLLWSALLLLLAYYLVPGSSSPARPPRRPRRRDSR